MKYSSIRSKKQYKEYARILDDLVSSNARSKAVSQEIELLESLIFKWDNDHNTFEDLDAIQLLRALMNERTLKENDLARILGVNKSLASDIMSYKRELSNTNILILSGYFKVRPEAFSIS